MIILPPPTFLLPRSLTKQEIVIAGLLEKTTRPKFEIRTFPGKGRGLVILENVPRGAYVIEYRGDVYPRKERASHEREYEANGEGCYILDIQTRDGWLCIDATRSLSSPGRLLNHATKAMATLTPYKPLFLNGKWRVGFTASRDLVAGEELTWDYGCLPGGLDWLKQRPQSMCKCTLLCICWFASVLLQGATIRALHRETNSRGCVAYQQGLLCVAGKKYTNLWLVL